MFDAGAGRTLVAPYLRRGTMSVPSRPGLRPTRALDSSLA
jgi:hypothetical protein